MNTINRLQADAECARAESSALRAGLYALRAYAYSSKHGLDKPRWNPDRVIRRIDKALAAASAAESEVRS